MHRRRPNATDLQLRNCLIGTPVHGEIFRIDPLTGTWVTQGFVSAGQAGGPLGLARDRYRDVLYITEWWTGQDARLVEFSVLTGALTPIAVLAGWRQIEGLTEIEFELGASYCAPGVPGVPNSTSSSGQMRAMGSAFVIDNDVLLEADQLPTQTFGYFLTSRTQSNFPQPGGNIGVFCLGGLRRAVRR